MIIDGIGRERYEVGDQYTEVMKDGKLHMLKVERSGASCLGCCYMTDCPKDHNGSCCSRENHKPCEEKCSYDPDFIIRDLGILNEDGLLACPFCGEFPTLKDELDENYESIYAIEHECEAVVITTGWNHDKQQVKDAWNRRAM